MFEEEIKELEKTEADLTRHPDWEEFWHKNIQQLRAGDPETEKEFYDYPLRSVKVFKIKFRAHDNARLCAWYLIPAFTSGKQHPCIIHFHGAGGNKGIPADYLKWTDLGFAVIALDIREQGGESGSAAAAARGRFDNPYCRGILDKEESYIKDIYLDAVGTIDLAMTFPEIDPDYIVLEGGSQGGGLCLAGAALHQSVRYIMADVPSMCHLEARVKGFNGVLAGVSKYLAQRPADFKQVRETLSYFDIINMAAKIKADILASVGLRDDICPAAMFFAAYNRIKTSKEVKIYYFNGHEGGGKYHEDLKLRRAAALLDNRDKLQLAL
ncbi:MAG TPA: acetylxylan esterase [Spirochaetota bacterium]|nr:acetylxylan esterase [Spirochaetota bacterium]